MISTIIRQGLHPRAPYFKLGPKSNIFTGCKVLKALVTIIMLERTLTRVKMGPLLKE
jgi:hypothetical protein